MPADNQTPLQRWAAKVDDVLDVGHQTEGWGSEGGLRADPGVCTRCSAPTDADFGFCGPCRAFLLGDTDHDPATRPWETEGDERDWQDEATRHRCQWKRHPEHGHLCGYVMITESHPLFGLGDDEAQPHFQSPVELTFIGTMDGADWWYGFDCGHYGDYMPGIATLLESIGGNSAAAGRPEDYKPAGYVEAMCALLAAALAEWPETGVTESSIS